MGGLISTLRKWVCGHNDIDDLMGQTIIGMDLVNPPQVGRAQTLVLTTANGDLYVGVWKWMPGDIADEERPMQVMKVDSNARIEPVGEANFRPFVVDEIYRDRHGLCNWFGTRCWVIVDNKQNRYEIYVMKLDLFSGFNIVSETTVLLENDL